MVENYQYLKFQRKIFNATLDSLRSWNKTCKCAVKLCYIAAVT